MPERGNGHAPGVGAGKPCPTCGKPAAERYRPFCSKRCADVDLHRWLSGAYAIPGTEDAEEDGAETGGSPEGKPGAPDKSRKDDEN